MYSNLGTQVGAQNEDFCCFADGLNQSLVIRVMSTVLFVVYLCKKRCNAFWGTRFSAFILSDFFPSLFISFIQCLAVSSTSNQPQQHQLKTTSTSLLRSSPGMGLGGVNIKTSGPPIRIGLSRNVRVKPLHAHVSVQHWIILSYASLHLVICILRTLHRHFFHQKMKGSKNTLNWPVWSKNFLLTMCGHILQIKSILVCSGLCADVPPSSSNIPEATSFRSLSAFFKN